MKTKMFEIRDAMTFIPVMATKMEGDNETDRYLLARACYNQVGFTHIVVMNLINHKCEYNPEHWDTVTMRQGHRYIIELFDKSDSDRVIDIEFLSGKSKSKKKSERLE